MQLEDSLFLFAVEEKGTTRNLSLEDLHLVYRFSRIARKYGYRFPSIPKEVLDQAYSYLKVFNEPNILIEFTNVVDSKNELLTKGVTDPNSSLLMDNALDLPYVCRWQQHDYTTHNPKIKVRKVLSSTDVVDTTVTTTQISIPWAEIFSAALAWDEGITKHAITPVEYYVPTSSVKDGFCDWVQVTFEHQNDTLIRRKEFITLAKHFQLFNYINSNVFYYQSKESSELAGMRKVLIYDY